MRTKETAYVLKFPGCILSTSYLHLSYILLTSYLHLTYILLTSYLHLKYILLTSYLLKILVLKILVLKISVLKILVLKVLVLKILVLKFFGTKSVTTISSEGGRQACVAQSSRPLFVASCVYQCTHISNGGYWLVLSREMLCAGGACCIARPWDPMDKVCVWHRPSLHPASNLS